ncbi:MAG: GIY-YIG nuclease family protein [Candidatus Dormibacteraeota bacterium]|nr:GIY-YIG nuclease family protein [Candidatus Dormibacteraeota bacterium]
MTPALRQALAKMAGSWAAGPLFQAIEPAGSRSERKVVEAYAAVYIATGATGKPLYVGSTRRPRSTPSQRIAEHLRDTRKASRWVQVYFLPLRPDTPRAVMLAIEADVAAVLSPSMGRRRPRPTRRLLAGTVGLPGSSPEVA